MVKKKPKQLQKRIDIYSIIKIIFLGILFFSPFFQGLFFEREYLVVATILGLLGLIYMIKTKEIHFDILDWLFVGLVLSYILSMINAASLRASYLGVLKYIMFFSCFYLARNIFKEEDDKKHLILSIISSVSFITVLTILTKAKVFNIHGLLSDNRFSGTFQYANTYAAVLAAVCIVLLIYDYNAQLNKNYYQRKFYLALTFLNVTALFATGSRGGVLIFGFALLLFVFLSKNKLFVFVNSLFLNAVSLASSILIFKISNSLIVLSLIIGGIVVVLLIDKFLCKLNYGSLVFALSGAILALTAVLFTIGKTPLQRLGDLSFNTSGFFVRFTFYQDALKLFSKNWLIGVGNGGWETLYTKVQTFPYTSKLVHSSVIQSLVDVGVIGTLFFLLLSTLGIIKYLQKRSSSNILIDRAVFLFFIVIFLHSLIDFDFSITIVAIFMFVFLGLIYGPCLTGKYPRFGKLTTLLLLFILVLSSTSFSLAGRIANNAVSGASSGKLSITKVKSEFGLSSRLDPFNALYRNYLGQAMVTSGSNNKDNEEIGQGLAKINEAISLEPNSYLYYLAKGQVLVKLNRYEEALAEYQKIIDIRPFHDTGYAALTRTYVTLAQQTKDPDALRNALEVYDRAMEKMSSIPQKHKAYTISSLNLENSVELNFYTGIASTLLGDYERGERLLANANKFGGRNPLFEEIKAWRIVCNKMMKKTIKLDANQEKIAQIENIVAEFTNKTNSVN